MRDSPVSSEAQKLRGFDQRGSLLTHSLDSLLLDRLNDYNNLSGSKVVKKGKNKKIPLRECNRVLLFCFVLLLTKYTETICLFFGK